MEYLDELRRQFFGETVERKKELLEAKVDAIIEGLGGIENIKLVRNSWEVLQFCLKNTSKINVVKLSTCGASELKILSNREVDVIFASGLGLIEAKLKEMINSDSWLHSLPQN